MKPRPWGWRLVERRLHRVLGHHAARTTMGDLLEDYRSDRVRVGTARASWRFWRDARSLRRAYSATPRGAGTMETTWQDVRYTLRLLHKAPGFSLVTIATLALGIGAATAIFSVVDAKLLRPLPYPNAGELVSVDLVLPPRDGRVPTDDPTAADRARWPSSVFSHVGAFHSLIFPRLAEAGGTERIQMAEVTDGLLAMHGVVPVAGREFTEADVRPGAPSVGMLGHGYWMRAFGGDRAVVGRTLRAEDEVVTVVGVLPPGYFPEFGLFRAMQLGPGRRLQGVTYARLRDGVSVEDAERRLTALLPPSPGGPRDPVGVSLERLVERATVSARGTLQMLVWAVLLVLVIACVNVAGLLLARGATRRAELGTRVALGGGRGRLLRQLLTESAVLATLGAALGVVLAWASLEALVANIPLPVPSRTSPVEPSLNLLVLGASVAIAAVSTLAFGLWPAIRLSCVEPAAMLSRADRRHGSGLTRRGGQVLMAAEVALAVVLVAGAGLMARSFARLLAVDLGFEPRHTITMRVLPTEDDRTVRQQYFAELLPAVRRLPGVVAASVGDTLPLTSGAATMTVDTAITTDARVGVTEVMSEYFGTMRMPVLRGRPINDDDVASGAAVVVINESAARLLFEDGDAVGRHLDIRLKGSSREVIGVVADTRNRGPRMPGDAHAYIPFSGGDITSLMGFAVVVRVEPGADGLVGALRDTASRIGPRVVVEEVQTGEALYGESVTRPRQRTVLLSLLGGMGLLLALVGVFGVTAYAVSHRTQEIAVRMALGARPGQVVSRMLHDAFVPIVLGTVVGLGIAAVATRAIQSFLFETEPTDPATFAAVAVALMVTGGLAAWVPSRRAAGVDPIAALRRD